MKQARKLLQFVVALLFISTTTQAAIAGTSIGRKIDDTVITTTVKGKLADDSVASAFNIHVETKNGRVKLKGQVDTTKELKRVIELVESVDGVKPPVDVRSLSVKKR